MAALFVAFGSSMVVSFCSLVVLLPLAFRFDKIAGVLFHAQFTFVGFFGVLFGTLVLEPASRRIGSWVLLTVGLGFYGWLSMHFAYLSPGDSTRELPNFWPLAIGGASAGVWFLWKSLSNASSHARRQDS
jgi:hypothetical protein